MASIGSSYRNRFLFSSILIFAGLYVINNFSEYILYSTGLIGVATLIVMYSGLRLSYDMNQLDKKTKQIASGYLDKVGKQKYKNNELGKIEKEFDDTLKQVKTLLATVQSTSDQLAGISEMLAAGSSEASNSVQKVSQTINRISASSSQQNTMLQNMKDKLRSHLNEINKASNDITEASYFVSKVAQRTNILGLNASIEASKAGKYGTGFNIVAQEIRELSNETKSSANRITETIEHVNYTIKNTIEQILKDADSLVGVAENTAEDAEEVSVTTGDNILPMISEISDTTSHLSTLAADLKEIMQSFKF